MAFGLLLEDQPARDCWAEENGAGHTLSNYFLTPLDYSCALLRVHLPTNIPLHALNFLCYRNSRGVCDGSIRAIHYLNQLLVAGFWL